VNRSEESLGFLDRLRGTRMRGVATMNQYGILALTKGYDAAQTRFSVSVTACSLSLSLSLFLSNIFSRLYYANPSISIYINYFTKTKF